MSILQTISTGSGSLITLDQAKAHLRVNTSADDILIQDCITSAQEYIEQETGIRFYADTYLEIFPSFPFNPAFIQLQKYPVVSISWIKYYDSQNNLDTLDPAKYYFLSPTNAQATLLPVWTSAAGFPPTYYRPDAVQIQYVTGVNPSPLAIQACKLLVAGFYLYRESEILANPKEMNFGVCNMLRKLDKRGYR